jgi:hypothetical protein
MLDAYDINGDTLILYEVSYMRPLIGSLALAFFSTLCAAFAQTPCEGLKSLSLPNTTITLAESIPAGPYRTPVQKPPPDAKASQAPAIVLPAY